MQYRIIALSVFVILAGCQTVLKTEPAAGRLSTGQKVLVDDGSCPPGQVKQVTGSVPGKPRQKECVPMPD
ncbi:DUF6719 family protein [Rhizobium halophilum]|uniref:DUF6719 family protein n=1 Tax=Rhizobium halophilum TaxID=2846852 RepID=UPI00293E879C|nr:DUF6719 family protein [Rhizobium halophilum]